MIAPSCWLQWGELSKRPQAGVGGMPDLALQLRVSKNALRSPAFQEEIISQVRAKAPDLLTSSLFATMISFKYKT